MSGTQPIGTVDELWRFPVKSMLGEQLETIEVTDRGTVGDRAYAVIDSETGKVASAKNPRKWGRLLDCTATFVEAPVAGAAAPPVRITLPDGEVIRSDESGADAALSNALGRTVTLATVAPDTRTLEEVWPDDRRTRADRVHRVDPHPRRAGGRDPHRRADGPGRARGHVLRPRAPARADDVDVGAPREACTRKAASTFVATGRTSSSTRRPTGSSRTSGRAGR